MSQFEALASQHIRKLKDGREVLFPQGMFGRVAYVIDSEKLKADIIKTLKTYNVLLAAVMIAFILFFGRDMDIVSIDFAIYMFALISISWLIAKLSFLRYTKKMEELKISNSIIDCFKGFGKKANIFALFYLVFFFGILALASLYFYLTTRNIGLLIGFSLTSPFGVGYSFALYHRFKNE